jgi:hypothetical protein
MMVNPKAIRARIMPMSIPATSELTRISIMLSPGLAVISKNPSYPILFREEKRMGDGHSCKKCLVLRHGKNHVG